MPPTPLRKRLTNEDKMKIIEESKQPGFCRKKTMDKYGISRSAISVILLKQKEFLKTMDSSPIAMKSKNIIHRMGFFYLKHSITWLAIE